MFKTGYMSTSFEKSITQLLCGRCGSHLGYEEQINDKEYTEIEGWEYCPYCGAPLYRWSE